MVRSLLSDCPGTFVALKRLGIDQTMHRVRIIAACRLAIACLVGSSTAAFGQSADTHVFESLRDPLTPKQTVFGGLSPAALEGPAMIRANPAGLSGGDILTFAASHRAWQFGLQQHWVGISLPAGAFALGAEVSAVHVGDLPAYDESGIKTGTFHPMELVAGIGAARSLGDHVRIGAATHLLRLTGPDTEIGGFSFSFGAQLVLLGSDVGIALRNLGPDMTSDAGSFHLPSEVSLGIERPFGGRSLVSVAAAVDRAGESSLNAGLSLRGPAGVALLGGAAYLSDAYDDRVSPRAGAEVELKNLRVSYGYIPEAELGVTHHFSLCFSPPKRPVATGLTEESYRPPIVIPTEPAPAAAPEEELWAVWGGTYRSPSDAEKEVRALGAEKIDGAEVVPQEDGRYRVRIAQGLAESEAEEIARRLKARSSPE